MQPPDGSGDWVTIARILGSRGNKGEVEAISETDFPERFESLTSAVLWADCKPRQMVTIENTWFHKGRVILKFAGVDSISDADRLAGYQLQVPETARPALAEGEYYLGDLVGFEVLDTDSGDLIGTVRAWHHFGAHPTLEVVDAGTKEELLIPFVPEICKVELGEKQIRATLPEGLRGLNL